MSSVRQVRAMTGAIAIAAASLLLPGCAATPTRGDPLEPLNRAMYGVHQVVDGNVVKPLVQGYVDYTPKLIQTGVRNVFNNIEDVISVINDVLQAKPDKAGNDMGRVMVNSGFGLLGLFDIASAIGIERGNEDFGQTLGYWGLGQGPYLFIPLIGPTTFRDGTGLIIRAYSGPVGYIPDVPVRNSLYGIGVVDLRAQALEAEGLVDRAALDRYTFIRRAYLQRREYLVHDGRPPPSKEDDE